MITVVAGLGRCGTTMLMRMLHAGGIPPYADSLASYETEKIKKLPADWQWLREADNMALKLLDPQRWRLPGTYSELQFKIILMTRNRREQAKSGVKLLVHTKEITGYNRAQVRAYERGLDKEEPLCKTELRKHDLSYLHLTFEEIIQDPLLAAVRIQTHMKRPMNIKHMAGQVKKRDVKCLPYLMEFDLINEENFLNQKNL